MIYFIRADDAIKIGFTKALKTRLATIRSVNPNHVEVLGTMEGGFNMEASLHARFESSRIQGEWYHPTQEVMEFIREHAQPYNEAEGEVLEMETRKQVFMPRVNRTLKALGERIKLARKRRNISAQLLAERSGCGNRTTYRKIERGDPGVAMGKYVMVLYSLGLIEDLDAVAEDDVLGRKLQDIALRDRAGRG